MGPSNDRLAGAVQHRVAIALGSNLGDRLANLRAGVSVVSRYISDLRASTVYESEPVGIADQPAFLNACCVGRTRLTACQLLSELQDAERAAGRQPGGVRYGPRELDMDVLLYDDSKLQGEHLTIPHPRLVERAFVLVPLSEIAADWIVPAVPGREATTVADLANTVARTGIERTEYKL